MKIYRGTHVHVCVDMDMSAGAVVLDPPGAEVTGGCEPSDMGAGNGLRASGRAVSAEPSLQLPYQFPMMQTLLLAFGTVGPLCSHPAVQLLLGLPSTS